jgi:glycosyltransferase involved in cell wall biosynthesis
MISVIIPTYNRYKFLCAAIKSVDDQTYDNIEIIVINDCSTEPEYANLNGSMAKHPLRIIHLPINMREKHNVGAAQGLTRNEGIRIARGEWIAFLDDDDRWLPNKLEIQMNYINYYKEQMCSTNMFVEGNKPYLNPLPNILKLEDILERNYINTSSVVISKALMDKVGEFKVGVNEDYDYWKRAMLHTNNIYINTPLVYYDINHGNGIHYKK